MYLFECVLSLGRLIIVRAVLILFRHLDLLLYVTLMECLIFSGVSHLLGLKMCDIVENMQSFDLIIKSKIIQQTDNV